MSVYTGKNLPVQNSTLGRLSGKKAWRQNLQLAAISAAKIESSLGPQGAYKLVHYNRGPEHVIKVTKDAAEVLKELAVQYPAVKTLAEAAKIHRQGVGDGTSTFVVLLAALLREAEAMMERKMHPNVILRGYLIAGKQAIAVVRKNSTAGELTEDDVLDMVDCGRDVLTPEIRRALKIAAARARTQGGVDLKRIRIFSRSGAGPSNSVLVKGVVIRKRKVHPSMKEDLHDVKVALVNKAFNVKPLELLMPGKGAFKIKLNVTDQAQMKRFKDEEVRLNQNLISPLLEQGVQLVFCRGKIKDDVADEMSRQGILGFEMIPNEDMEALAEATGATPVGDVMNLTEKDTGHVDRVWTENIEGLDYAMVEAEKGSTIILRGSSREDVEETERVMINAVRVLGRVDKENKTVWGGGAIYMQMAARLREYALDYPGKEQVAIEGFANALEEIPTALITNFGRSYSSTLPELRSHHSKGEHRFGVTYSGCADMSDARVRDMASTTMILISRAYEVSTLLLRVDEYFYVKDLALVHKQ